jgi:hypothetical protein
MAYSVFPSKATWTVVWGGETITAPSAFDVLATIGERSFVPSDAKYPKRGIAFRVWNQYRVILDPDESDETFLTLLAEYGIITLTVSGTPLPNALQEALDFYQSFHQNIDNN